MNVSNRPYDLAATADAVDAAANPTVLLLCIVAGGPTDNPSLAADITITTDGVGHYNSLHHEEAVVNKSHCRKKV